MTRITLSPALDATDLIQSFDALRAEYGLQKDYPQAAVAEAEQAIAEVHLPDRDETQVPFFTIDPVGSKDLDQAMYLERLAQGYRVRYAIADVAAFVRPGGALDAETRRRGETVYMPDMRIPLHPAVMSEGAVSLLPGQVCSAFVWDMTLDSSAEVTESCVYRARVKSVDRLDYEGVQAGIDAATSAGAAGSGTNTVDPRFVLLKEIGELRAALEVARGGASLPMPEQEVSQAPDGTFSVHFRPPVASEDWNAQISLMTGMVAASMMLKAGVGILRTMPEAKPEDVERFRRQAQALGVVWPSDQTYGAFLRGLDRTNPQHLSLIYEAVGLFRGAGYTPFDGAAPSETIQAAVAAPYAHVTAPLRRLVDRFGLVICAAISANEEVPSWAREALGQLPDIMHASDSLAAKVDRACVDRVEAASLAHRVGDAFPAFVIEGGVAPEAPADGEHSSKSASTGTPGLSPDLPSDSASEVAQHNEPKQHQGKSRLTVQLTEQAVVAPAHRPEGMALLTPGQICTVRLVSADVMNGKLDFEVVPDSTSGAGVTG